MGYSGESLLLLKETTETLAQLGVSDYNIIKPLFSTVFYALNTFMSTYSLSSLLIAFEVLTINLTQHGDYPA